MAFEANVLCPVNMPHGAVAAFFSYNLRSQNPFKHDEIDFEFASRHWSGSNEQINTNVYVDDDDGTALDEVVATSVDFSQPITFRIEWLRHGTGIRWFINKQPIRSEVKVPQSPMSIVLNFWVPDQTWPWAYSDAIQPTGSAGALYWTYQVNWAKVYTA